MLSGAAGCVSVAVRGDSVWPRKVPSGRGLGSSASAAGSASPLGQRFLRIGGGGEVVEVVVVVVVLVAVDATPGVLGRPLLRVAAAGATLGEA